MRTNYLVEYLRESAQRCDDDNHTGKVLKTNLFMPNSISSSKKWEPVCSQAFCSIFSLSSKTLVELKKIVEHGQVALGSKNHEALAAKGEARRQNLLLYLKEEFGLLCDFIPCPEMSTKDYHLPKCVSKETIYNEYVIEFTKRHEDYDFCGSNEHLPYSSQRFFALWQEHYPYVTVPETMAFSVCTVCATLHDRILTATKSKDKFMLRELKGMRRTHLGFISEERMHYRNHQDLARKYPDLYVSLCIDGMDQSKCNVPHWAGNGIPKGKGV